MTDKESQPFDNSGGAPDLTPVKTERAGIPRDRTKQNRTEPDIFEVKMFCSVFNMTKYHIVLFMLITGTVKTADINKFKEKLLFFGENLKLKNFILDW